MTTVSNDRFDLVKGWLSKLAFLIALVAAVYHLQLVLSGIPEAYKFRTTHLLLLLPLGFLLKPVSTPERPYLIVWDFLLVVASLVATSYIAFVEYDTLIMRLPGIDELTSTDMFMGTLLVLLVLEGARRVVGMGMVVICIAAILYTLYGYHIPGTFNYSGSSYHDLLDKLVFTTDGIFSIPLAAAATFIFLFVLFGKFLERSGAGELFIELSFALAGRSRGGPAKMAVLSSAFMGSISGSATANVVSTGAYTIPLMKKSGYSPAMSGAVEAAASTGGQLLPPVMGAAAFLLADFVGIPYTSLIVIAAIPALLFFFGIYVAVHFESVAQDMKGLNEDQIPKWSSILSRAYLLLPLVVVIAVLFMGYTPYLSACIALVSVIVCCGLHPSTRMGPKAIVMALVDGTKDAVMITVTCAAAGIIIGVAAETGLGVKFTSIVLSTASDNVFLLLFFMMLASLVLGMGLPTSAAYILIVAIAAPTLIEAGVTPIAAHLFILYFGVFSAITPPVAISSYAAAGLAEASPMTTSLHAFRLSIPAFVVPYLFVYHNELLLIGAPMDIAVQIISGAVAMVFLASGLAGCFHKRFGIAHRIFMLIASFGLMYASDFILTAAIIAVTAAVLYFTVGDQPVLGMKKNENHAS
ncbi:TRAP transporter fused permease subunit [Rhodobacteraceae bacterium RKSG542]|uniref:TRAP transporter permease n=1 Tax=Pseudovibrio flavus TaxID=2529854 RepID=UPI0012BC5368|nr:TRAP transporter fused permease subunit [Pseudovibrio flavus]MTI17653.1 TRAP transporter fused permease subunit [Pseudovibrio flavus]